MGHGRALDGCWNPARRGGWRAGRDGHEGEARHGSEAKRLPQFVQSIKHEGGLLPGLPHVMLTRHDVLRECKGRLTWTHHESRGIGPRPRPQARRALYITASLF